MNAKKMIMFLFTIIFITILIGCKPNTPPVTTLTSPIDNQKLAVWIFIELNKTLRNEIDSDVREDIIYTLKKVKANFTDIEKNIEKTNRELDL